MKKWSVIVCALLFIVGLTSGYFVDTVSAAPPFENKCDDGKDNDGDGAIDCADSDCTADPACQTCTPTEDPEVSCTDGVDNDCNGSTDCDDANCASDPACQTCTVTEDPEVSCSDGVDNDCNGATDCADANCATDPACQSSCAPTPGHDGLVYADYPTSCIGCHGQQASDMEASVHYQWQGNAPDMVNGASQQGKLDTAPGSGVNSYCINILGNWPVCGSCHVGRGARPDSGAGVENIDCLMCHNAAYAENRVRLSDGSMGVATPDDCYVQEVTAPTRKNCLMCHAKAGGGDGVKRGDLSLADISNADPHFDVHMNTASSDMTCQSCHTFVNHKVTGKGSDLRPTDYASEVSCVTCHTGKNTASGHATAEVNNHVDRVACQTCQIPTYGKVATETDRDWRIKHDGTDATTCGDTPDDVPPSCPGHPHTEKAANLLPEFMFWDRTSDNALLHDVATMDTALGTYPTSRPVGDINGPLGNKLYPFKYKVAQQPKTAGETGVLVAIDTFEYLKKSGNINKAIAQGLTKMGLSSTEPVEWVTTDTYALLNHGVEPASVVTCTQCHPDASLDTTVTTKLDAVGYALKDANNDGVTNLDDEAIICSQCHRAKALRKDSAGMHGHLAKGSGTGCNFCHTFSRPERGLCEPCNPDGTENTACINEFVDGTYYDHCPN